MLFLGCVLRMKEAPAAKEDYFAAHVNAGSEGASTARGSHAGFLSRLLSANASGWFVESGLTVAGARRACTEAAPGTAPARATSPARAAPLPLRQPPSAARLWLAGCRPALPPGPLCPEPAQT